MNSRTSFCLLFLIAIVNSAYGFTHLPLRCPTSMAARGGFKESKAGKERDLGKDSRLRAASLPTDASQEYMEELPRLPENLERLPEELENVDLQKFDAGIFANSVLNDPVKRNLALNTLVVAGFVTFAGFQVLSVDSELSRGWTFWETMLRMPFDNFYRYESSVQDNAVFTKALTSMTAYGFGDFLAQLLKPDTSFETLDLRRTARSALAGLMVHGPLCHFWIQFMEAHLSFGGAWWSFLPKVVADQTGYSLFLNAAYTTFVVGLTGEKRPKEVLEEVRSTAIPAITSSWRFWPLIHCLSFSNLIPVDVKLLFIDFMEVIWVCILSSVANKDREGLAETTAE